MTYTDAELDNYGYYFVMCPKTRLKYSADVANVDQVLHPDMVNITPEEANWMTIDLTEINSYR